MNINHGSGSEDEENETIELNPEDILEVIDIDDDDAPGDDAVAEDMEDMNIVDDEEEPFSVRDDASVTFLKHQGSVFCISMNKPNNSLVVSGGEDDKAYVWNIDTGEQILDCLGHKDSVTCACFSNDSQYVATGDMSGLIKVWSIESCKEVWSFEVSDLEWLDWHPVVSVLLAGTVDGDVWMWKVPSGDCKTFQGHGSRSCVGKILPDGKKVVVGYEDGAVKIWDLKLGQSLHNLSGHGGHSSALTSLDCNKDGTLIITGSTDVTSKLISATNCKALTTFLCGEHEDDADSVEAVNFATIQPIVATGTLKGSMRLWDVPTQVQRHHCQHEAGIVRIANDPTSPVVYSCTLDGLVHMWDGRTGKREEQWSGHTAEILDMTLSSDGCTLATASGDHTARVFSLQMPDR